MNLNVTSKECAWAQLECNMLGRTIKGLLSVEAKKSVEKEHIYASGDEPIDITSGNKKYEGSIKVLGFEADAMNKIAQAAGYDDITGVPHELIVITLKWKKNATDTPNFKTIRGVAFTEDVFSQNQNDKKREVSLPYLAMSII
ncbi:MAG: hypothetical protein RBS07_15785 [Lentimicrobium sp.]|jgi:hypothetical protein|nr:hypothetical protein [Lentimicrobium sp.]